MKYRIRVKNIYIFNLVSFYQKILFDTGCMFNKITKLLFPILTILSVICMDEHAFAKSWQFQQADKLSIAILQNSNHTDYALGLVASTRTSCKADFFISRINVRHPVQDTIMKVNGKYVKMKKSFRYKQAVAYHPQSTKGKKYLQSQLTTSNELTLVVNNSTIKFNIDEFILSTKTVTDNCKIMKKHLKEAL